MTLPSHRFFPKNEAGVDYAVGDIHGNFPALEKKLDSIGFDKTKDRLFATGDLVDKGFQSRMAYAWLQSDWFFSVLGNHDDHVARFGLPTKGKWLDNYGVWFSRLKPVFQAQMQEVFSRLPLAITLEIDAGFVGIVHAGTPYDTWYETLSHMDSTAKKEKINHFLHSRLNFNNRKDAVPIRDLEALLVGHCPVDSVEKHSNTWYMDTNGYITGDYQIINLKTFEIL